MTIGECLRPDVSSFVSAEVCGTVGATVGDSVCAAVVDAVSAEVGYSWRARRDKKTAMLSALRSALLLSLRLTPLSALQ